MLEPMWVSSPRRLSTERTPARAAPRSWYGMGWLER
jgi:hypothetical protein